MKEFDKIYVAKYYEAIPKWQLSRDLGIKVDKLESIVDELKKKAYMRYIKDYQMMSGKS